MKPVIQSGGAVHDRSSWTVPLFLLAAVLAPTACMLWYMNDALNSQRDMARRKLAQVYRAQLGLVPDRLDSFWEQRASALDAAASKLAPAAAFAACIRAGLADSVIVLDRDGAIAYPNALIPGTLASEAGFSEARQAEANGNLALAIAVYARIGGETEDPGLAARALQAQVRCLVQSGNKSGALDTIDRSFRGSRLAALDPQGRAIAADEYLLAVHLSRGSGRFVSSFSRLEQLLNDYGAPIPSTQRLFLMDELRAAGKPSLPTYSAERLAASFLATDRPRVGESALQRTGMPQIWKFASTSGKVVALYRLDSLLAALETPLTAGEGMQLLVNAPGAPLGNAEEWISGGVRMPGWQLGWTPKAPNVPDGLARSQTLSYVWVGFLAIALTAVLAVIAAQKLRRQVRLAQLKTDLVAAVSHELKTPLSSMRLLVDSLLEQDAPEPRQTREYLGLIARENARLSRLIDNFLTFSRLERRRQSFEFAGTAARELVESVAAAASERFQSPPCPVRVEVEDNLPAVRADQDALSTALLNLIDNAYKFTPEDKRILLRAYAEPGRVCFAVRDNGIGIEPAEQKRIFRKFYQVDRRLSRAAGGCGLGLSIVESIVAAHGGEVRVESKPGEGSTFTVALQAMS